MEDHFKVLGFLKRIDITLFKVHVEDNFGLEIYETVSYWGRENFNKTNVLFVKKYFMTSIITSGYVPTFMS